MENLAALVASMVDNAFSSVATRINHLKNYHQRIRRMKLKLRELSELMEDLKKEVDKAELRGSTRTRQVEGWLSRAKKTADEAVVVLEPPEQHGMCYIKPSCTSRYKLSKRALAKESEINDLILRKESLSLTVSDIPSIDLIPIWPTVGLGTELEIALQTIADDQVQIFGIHGMGGVGKTTLLKMINNEYLSRMHEFEAVVWLTVNKDYGVDRIQRALLSRLGLTWDEAESQEQLKSRIHNFMMKIKFLLLLDDVWERLELADIGIPVPKKENKCKVVFTTRSADVCSDMGANKELTVAFLNEEFSWCLFKETASGTDIMKPDIKPYAEAIVKKCRGLPLALITVGRAMANRKTVEEWKYAIEALNNAPSEIRGMEDVFTALKFSYDTLHNDTLKKCFLYCALFPDDYPIDKDQLIDYWIGEGFLDSSTHDSLCNKGHSIIGSLKAAGLIESGEDDTQIKMHDVVRSFALWIACNCGKNKEKVVVQGCNGLPESPEIEKWQDAMWISLLDNEITMLPEVPICPNLTTLLLNWNTILSKISNRFFEFMPKLKVLDLSVTSIREIPASIGQLVELQYLDLSRSKITALPEELGCLSKLRHLDLQRTHWLRKIPRIISGLSNLRVLNLYYSYAEWKTLHLEAEKEMSFSDLQLLRHLTAIGITVTDLFLMQKLSSFNNILDCIQYLFIKGCEGLIYLLVASPYGGGDRLRRLSVYNCSTLKEIDLGSEAGKDWLPSLEVLSLHTLPKLTTRRNSVSSQCHRNLRYINIWYCPKLKNLSWILQLPRLEKIYLFHCDEIEEIIGENDAIRALELDFPRLQTISFRGLPKLRSISKVAISFPTLKTIALIDCPQLKTLPSTGYIIHQIFQ